MVDTSSNVLGSLPVGFQEVFRWNISQVKNRMLLIQLITGAVFILSAAAYILLAALVGRIKPDALMETLTEVLTTPYNVGVEIGRQLAIAISGVAGRIIFQALGSILLGLGCLLLLLLITAVLHEGAHGAAMRMCGARPTYGIIPTPLMFYATSPGFAYTRAQYIWVGVAPLLGVDLLLTLAMVLTSGLTGLVVLAMLFSLNTAGAVGDLWILSILLRFPSHAYVVDEKDGLRIFLPAGSSEKA